MAHDSALPDTPGAICMITLDCAWQISQKKTPRGKSSLAFQKDCWLEDVFFLCVKGKFSSEISLIFRDVAEKMGEI